jgi:hypothetical protein
MRILVPIFKLLVTSADIGNEIIVDMKQVIIEIINKSKSSEESSKANSGSLIEYRNDII